MNSSGRLFSALQVKEIYRRRARARLERGRRSRAGEVETLQQRRYRACRGRSEGRATASWLAAERRCDVGGEGWRCCVEELAVARGPAALESG